MHELYELKEMLCKELKGYGSQPLTVSSLEFIDKLSHSIKNIDKIIEAYQEEEYSQAYAGGGSNRSMAGGSRAGGGSYGNGGLFGQSGDGSYGYSNEDSFARGRGSRASRDSMGRYSRGSSDIRQEIMRMAENATDANTKRELQMLLGKM